MIAVNHLIEELQTLKLSTFSVHYTLYHCKFLQMHLMLPNTFMNLSGSPVKKVLTKLKLEPSEVLVVHDELEMAIGKFRHAGPGLSAKG